MNDITPAHELMGKVVVVTGMTSFPTSCYTCPYFREIGVCCSATGELVFFKDISYLEERQDFCPLRIVGR